MFSPHPFKPIHQFLVTFAFACPGVQCDLNFVQTEDGKISSANAAPCLLFCSKYFLNIVLSIVYTNPFRKDTSCSKMSLGCWVVCRPGITNTSCMTRRKQSNAPELEHQIKVAEPKGSGVSAETCTDEEEVTWAPALELQHELRSDTRHTPVPRVFSAYRCVPTSSSPPSSYIPTATDLLSRPPPCSSNSQLFIEELLLKVKAQSA